MIEIDRACQCIDVLPYLVKENSFMSCKDIIRVILDVKPLYNIGLLPTWLVLLQVDICIPIVIIMEMSYEDTLLYF